MPHFTVCVDDVRRWTEDALHNLLLSSGLDMTCSGEFPKNNFGVLSAGTINESRCGLSASIVDQTRSDFCFLRAPVMIDPLRNHLVDVRMEYPALGQRKRRGQTSMIESARVVDAMKMHHRQSLGRLDFGYHHTAGNGRDCSKILRHLCSQPVGHHRAIGHACSIDSSAIDGYQLLQPLQQRDGESHIIDIV